MQLALALTMRGKTVLNFIRRFTLCRLFCIFLLGLTVLIVIIIANLRFVNTRNLKLAVVGAGWLNSFLNAACTHLLLCFNDFCTSSFKGVPWNVLSSIKTPVNYIGVLRPLTLSRLSKINSENKKKISV